MEIVGILFGSARRDVPEECNYEHSRVANATQVNAAAGGGADGVRSLSRWDALSMCVCVCIFIN